MVRVVVVVLVNDRMNHDGLLVDGKCGICWYRDP